MKKTETENAELLYCLEYLVTAISDLIKAGKSEYEIAMELKAHPKLIREYTLDEALVSGLRKNNELFILRLNSQFQNQTEFEKELFNRNIIISKQGKYIFYRKFPKTANFWIKKNKDVIPPFRLLPVAPRAIPIEKPEVPRSPENLNPPPNSEQIIETRSHPDSQRAQEILNCYLDGNTIRDIMKRFNCDQRTVKHILKENGIDKILNKEIPYQRLMEAIKQGDSKYKLMNRFGRFSALHIETLRRKHRALSTKKIFIEAAPEPNLTLNFPKKPVARKNPFPITENWEQIKEDYASGIPPDKIAAKFNFTTPSILSILRKFKIYAPLNLVDMPDEERDKKVAEYFKRGWNMLNLADEFNLRPSAIARLLEAKGFNVAVPVPPVRQKPKKHSQKLCAKYYLSGMDEPAIADKLNISLTRVIQLLKNEGVIPKKRKGRYKIKD